VGVTTHQAHLETHFSVRTRVLDYLWAGLPLISSAGDVFSELSEQQQLGLIVAPGDVDSLARAILKLASDTDFRQACAAHVSLAAQEFHWNKVAQPLVEFCQTPHPAIDRDFGRAGAARRDRALSDPADELVTCVRPTVRRVRRSIPARLTAHAKVTAKKLLRRRYIGTFGGRAVEVEGELLSGQQREQLVSIENANLTGFKVLIGTFGRVNTCEVVLHVCTTTSAANEVTKARVNALRMNDGEFCPFTFPPLHNSTARQFCVWLESPDAVVSDCVTLFRYLDTGELVLLPLYGS
jgi:hypothetical protein